MAEIHPDFNASDADVVIQSSDGVRFHLHRANLNFSTGAFPGTEFKTEGEVVILTEPENVLQILFQFVYPRRHPNLKDQGFETVAAIAEAAGKYEVFPAINTCVDRLIQLLPTHVEELLLLGMKHDFMELINEAALHIPLSQIVSTAEKMPVSWVFPWLNFTERIKAETFGKMEEWILRISESANMESYCMGRRDSPCNSCRYSISRWIGALQLQSLHSARDSAVRYHEISRHGHCSVCQKTPQWSCYVPDIVGIFKKGFSVIPRLTDFKLRPEKYSKGF